MDGRADAPGRRGPRTAGVTMNQSEMTAKIQQGDGFIAALDQSGGSTPKALGGYGIDAGIAVLVAQQFQVARQVLDHGLVPIVEPEVNIKSADRAECDDLLLTAILEELDELPEDQRVMLKLSIPAEAGKFEPLVMHPRVLRVVALSGCFSREDACRQLAQNPGMIAAFRRALLSDLRAQQSDEEFNHTLGTAIDEIYRASTQKVPA